MLFKQLKAKKKAEAIRAAADQTTAEEAVVDISAKAELHAEVATEEPILIETASSSVSQLSMDDQLVELQRWVTVGSHREWGRTAVGEGRVQASYARSFLSLCRGAAA